MAININKKEGDKLHAEEWNELAQEVMGKQPRLNIVDDLDSDSSVDVLSAKQGKILDEKINSATSTIEGISEKVNKLPTGYYYGQFDSVSGLPDASQSTQKGYAYVASEDPSIYYIYLFDGEGSSWEDSGNKFVTTVLEDDLSTKSESKAPTTKVVAESIEEVDLTKAKTASTELTSTQKYNANANISNRIADVEAETGVVKALGYKVLDKRKRFAEQVEGVNNANTIFEIKDSFDLDGESVTIPANCTLKFNGGRIKNGTIVGDDLQFTGNYVNGIHVLISGNILTKNLNVGNVADESIIRSILASATNGIVIIDDITFTATNSVSIKTSITSVGNKTLTFAEMAHYGLRLMSSNISITNITLNKLIPTLTASDGVLRGNYRDAIYSSNKENITISNNIIHGGIHFVGDTKTQGEKPLYADYNGVFITNNVIDLDMSSIETPPKLPAEGRITSHCLMFNGVGNIHIENNTITTYDVLRTIQVGGTVDESQTGDAQYTNMYCIPVGIYIRNNNLKSTHSANLPGNDYGAQMIDIYPAPKDVFFENNIVYSRGNSSTIDDKYHWIRGRDHTISIKGNTIDTDSRVSYFFNNADTNIIYTDNIVYFNGVESEQMSNKYLFEFIDMKSLKFSNNVVYNNSTFSTDDNNMRSLDIHVCETSSGYSKVYSSSIYVEKNTFYGNYSAGITTVVNATPTGFTKAIDELRYINNWFENNPATATIHSLQARVGVGVVTVEDYKDYGNTTPYILGLALGSGVIDSIVINVNLKTTKILSCGTSAKALATLPKVTCNVPLINPQTSVGDTSSILTNVSSFTNPLLIPWAGLVGKKYSFKGRDCSWNGTKWIDSNGHDLKLSEGTSSNRPSSPSISFRYFDTTLGKPIYWNGSAWVDANGGYIVDNSGTLQNRLALTSPVKGQQFKLTGGANDVYLIYGNYGWLKATDGTPWFDDSGTLNAIYDKYNYALLTEQPSDWTTKYNTYYKKVNDAYTLLTTAETWAADTYYKKDVNAYKGIQVKLTDTDTSLRNKVVKWDGAKYINIVDNVALKAGTPIVTFTTENNTTTATITSTSSGKIYYTKDGNDPTSSSTEYSSAITLADGDQVKAICIRDHMDNSALGFVPVSTPVITFSSAGILTITCETPNAKIYYTIDGNAPTTSSTEYDSSASVTIAKNVTVKAFAVLIGRVNSDVASKKRS